MKKLCLIAIMLVCMSATVFAAGASESSAQVAGDQAATKFSAATVTQTQAGKIAIVPYIDNSEQKKDYIAETVHANYDDAFAANGFDIVPELDTAQALENAGFDADNAIVPDKDVLSDIAKATGADYVVAMEIDDIDVSRHMSMFQTKVRAVARLRYNFYMTAKDRVYAFQTTGEYNNKAVFGDVGFKGAIQPALEQAMSRANAKIQSYVTAAKDVNVHVANE